MSDFQGESRAFDLEVEAEAAKLVRDGYAGPFEALRFAREMVLLRRQEAARQRRLARAETQFR
jgi:hypothetical protein